MSTQGNKLKAIADAIRAKEGSSAPIVANDFPARIAAIETGVDTSDATAAASDILVNKTAYVKGDKVVGTMPSIVVPSPSITVSSNGLITATSTQSAGYSAGGTESATKQLSTQAAKTVTPGRSAQTAVGAGKYTTGAVKVAGDANLKAENIKEGVSIYGIQGSLQPLKKVTVKITNTANVRLCFYSPSTIHGNYITAFSAISKNETKEMQFWNYMPIEMFYDAENYLLDFTGDTNYIYKFNRSYTSSSTIHYFYFLTNTDAIELTAIYTLAPT